MHPMACRIPDPCMHPVGADHTHQGSGRLGRGSGEPAEQGYFSAGYAWVSPAAGAGLCGTHTSLSPVHHKPVATRRQRLLGRVGRTGGPADADTNATSWGCIWPTRGCNERDAPFPSGPPRAPQAAPSVGRLPPPCSGLASGGGGAGCDNKTELVQSWQLLRSGGEFISEALICS